MKSSSHTLHPHRRTSCIPFVCFSRNAFRLRELIWMSLHSSRNGILSQSQSHTAIDGRSVSKSWCRAPSGAHDQIFITVWQLRSRFVGHTLWRDDGSVFCICCWPLPFDHASARGCILSRAESSSSLLPATSQHSHSWHRPPLGLMAIYLFSVKNFVVPPLIKREGLGFFIIGVPLLHLITPEVTLK
jgi:hypothetical protein